MAAPMAFRRKICYLARIFTGISQLGTGGPGAFRDPGGCKLIRSHLPLTSTTSIHSGAVLSSIPASITVTDEPDTLYQKVSVLVKGHDRAVLNSYEFFATLAAKELGITLGSIFEPPKHFDRFTLLKSVHIYKKHRVQYEMRTHYRCIELSHLTGSTAQVYLEYIQRNLPEGVAMEVSKVAMEKVPEHILEPMWKNQPLEEEAQPPKTES